MTIWWVWVPYVWHHVTNHPPPYEKSWLRPWSDVKWSIREKNVSYEGQPSVSLIFLAHSDVFCDLLLNRPAAWWRNKLLSRLTSSIRLFYYRPYETIFLEIERVTGLFIDRNKTLHSPLILEKSASAVPMNDVIFHKLYICNLRAKFTRINWIINSNYLFQKVKIFLYIYLFSGSTSRKPF